MGKNRKGKTTWAIIRQSWHSAILSGYIKLRGFVVLVITHDLTKNYVHLTLNGEQEIYNIEKNYIRSAVKIHLSELELI